MKLTDASVVENIVWEMKRADFQRAQNRALIDSLFGGLPPFSAEEQIQNRISTNVNFLDSNRIAQDARSQFSSALSKPGNYFSVKLDSGPIHKREEWSSIITQAINKRMKRSTIYGEMLNNVIGSLVLHGVGPVSWSDKQSWCPTMHGMQDVLIPSRTLLTMENLSHFAIFRRYTAAELYRKTHGPRVDKAWNMPVVEKAIKWAATQYGQSIASSDMLYSPEQWQADIQNNSTLYASDQVPTIDCWDTFWLDDSDKEWGWKRRIVLDCPAPSQVSGGKIAASNKSIIDGRNEFLYNPGDRNYASKLSEILHFQFADGSVVAPFRYHSVRSLGFLLYAVAHLQNRLRCKLNDSTFEALLNYFRVANPEDAERLQKVDLMNLGIIPEGLSFVPPQERWQINQNLVQQTMLMNRQSMAENSTSYTKDFGYEQGRKSQEKTATEVSAEVAAATAMVGSMLQKAYGYQEGQYREIARRFCIKNSKDADVRAFRAACLKDDRVPEEVLNAEQWEIAAERTIGSGNKQAELAQLNLLMQVIDRYDPDAQRIILRRYTMASVDDPKLAAELVPEERKASDSVLDAEDSAAALLLGLPTTLHQGKNHAEFASVQLGLANTEIQKLMQSGGMATQDQIGGLQNLLGMDINGQVVPGNGAENHILILEQSDGNKQIVKQLRDIAGKQLNELKGFAQRLAEQEQQGQEGNGQLPADEVVKLKALLVQAEAKAESSKAAAAQKLQHKEEAFRQKLQQSQEKSELQNADTIRKTQVQESALDVKTAAEIAREGSRPPQSPSD